MSQPGMHTVALCLTVGTSSWACMDAASPTERERVVTVWPTISGRVHDGSAGVPGVVVSANSVPGGATSTTDAEGYYSLAVPFGWSGSIFADHINYDFDPAIHALESTTAHIDQVDFLATVAQEDTPLCTGDAHCSDDVYCNGAEICSNGECISGSPPCSGQHCDETTASCVDCLDDSHCDNGLFCDGSERCISGSCVSGDAPCSADESCDEETASCGPAGPDCTTDADCDDAAYCNGSETCVDGSCVAGINPCSSGAICMESTDDCVTSTAWTPPIGIPAPDFGILETVEAIHGDPDFFTHYVDNSGTCSDSSNGTPANPRCTIPLNVAAGSVVEIHGGPYDYNGCQGGKMCISGSGTSDNPVFFRGGDSEFMPVLANREVLVLGQYVILEYIDFTNSKVGFRAASGSSNHHLVLRHSTVHDFSGTAVYTLGYLDNPDDRIEDVVIYANDIHSLGDWQSSVEKDWHCVLSAMNSRRVWILDNELHHNQGDGVQINAAGAGANQVPAEFIYVGRNHIHHNHENALDFKISFDVIVSENTMHDVRVPVDGIAFASGEIASVHNTNSSAQYPYPDRIWFIYNELYNGDRGFKDTGSAGVYIIGNVIHNIAAVGVDLMEDNAYSVGAGIQQWGHSVMHVVNNTLVKCDLGILSGGFSADTSIHVSNNIISDLNDNYTVRFGADPYHLFVEDGAVAARSLLSMNIIAQPSGSLRMRWNGEYSSVGALQSSTTQCQGCSSDDPQFQSIADHDFRPLVGSPAIDAGSTASVYDTFHALYGIDIRMDRDHSPRPLGQGPDIGAYEQ